MFGESIRKSDHLVRLWVKYFGVFCLFGLMVAFVPLFLKIREPAGRYTAFGFLILLSAVFGALFGWVFVSQISTLMALRREGNFFSSKTEHSEKTDWVHYLKSIGGLRRKLMVIIVCELLFWTIIGEVISIVFKILFRRQTKRAEHMVSSKMEGEGSR